MTYSVKDIQHRYNVTEQTVLGWIHSNELKALNVGRAPGKKKPRWRITQESLDSFEALRTQTPPQPRTRRRRKCGTEVVERYK